MREYKYLFGSKMLKLENTRDEDWLIFIDEPACVARNLGRNYMSIPFYQAVHSHFIKGTCIRPDPFKALYLYQISNGFIDEVDYPFANFNILEHKEVWIKWLKAYVNSEQTEVLATKTEVLPKQFYHILYQYYMIKESTHWISEESKKEVQKIHDLEVSSNYFEQLKSLINGL